METIMKNKSMLLTLGASLSLGLAGTTNATQFQAEKLDSGYSNAKSCFKLACGNEKCNGSCGGEKCDGKCNTDKKSDAPKSDNTKSDKKSDSKCGAGKCGSMS